MDIIKEIKKLDIDKIYEDEELSKHNTYHVGGKCLALIMPDSVEKLISVLNLFKDNNISFKILGKGSNIVFSSKYYDGIIIKLDELKTIIYDNTNLIVEAGVPLISLAFDTANQGLTGLEFASGIPGTIGGAIYMNAGAYKNDMSEIVKDVTYLDKDNNIHIINNNECNFKYRSSIFKEKNEYIILKTTLELKLGDKNKSLELIEDRKRRRIESQPLDYPSAGSVFRNPEEVPAGKLIEDAGLKGKQIGGAKVSEKHANFIINNGGATGEDIKELIEYIQREIKNKYNIELVLEQELFNF